MHIYIVFIGAVGVVYKGICKITGKAVAIKELEKGLVNENFNDILNEVNILKDLNHPNIIKVYKYFNIIRII